MRITNKQRDEILKTLCEDMERIRAIPLERIQEEINFYSSQELSEYTLGDVFDTIQEHNDAN